jgi:hypothetical protein
LLFSSRERRLKALCDVKQLFICFSVQVPSWWQEKSGFYLGGGEVGGTDNLSTSAVSLHVGTGTHVPQLPSLVS